MKKKLILFLSFMSISMFCAIAADGVFEYNGIKYEPLYSGEARIIEAVDKEISGELIIPDTVENESGVRYKVIDMEEEAFKDCVNIESVRIEASEIWISYMAFHGCSNLKSLWLGSVTGISQEAFEGCNNIQEIYFDREKPLQIKYNTFAPEVYQNAVLYVPEASVSVYNIIYPWRAFKNIRINEYAGIGSIRADIEDNMPYQIYDVNGVKVGERIETLPAGIYIVTQGTTTKKIAVK